MQACVYEDYGPPEVVHVDEVAKPEPRAGEVRVRVHAASVTTADHRFRASDFPRIFWLPGRLMTGLFRPRNPVLGMDFSGVVDALGPGVTRFQVGQAVFGASSATRRGAHAEYVVVEGSGAIVHKPSRLGHAEAAAIPFGAGSALAFLRDFAQVKAGQRVLVVGASGGVGVWAVQLARHLGAEVTGVCSTGNVELVRALGAHHVVDYTKAAYAQPGDGYDLIFDTVGVTTFAGSRAALSERGVYLPLNSGLREMLQALRTAWSSGRRLKYGISGNTRQGLEDVLSLLESGALRPVVDTVYPMHRIAEAHRHVESRHRSGAVIVTPGVGAD